MYLKPVLEYTCWIFTLIEALGHKLEVFLFFIYLFFFDEASSSEKVLNYTFTLCINQFLQLNTFFFFSFKLLFISTRFLCLLICLSLAQCWIFCYLYCFEVFIFVPFRTLLMLVSVNKAKFSLEKKFIAF